MLPYRFYIENIRFTHKLMEYITKFYHRVLLLSSSAKINVKEL